MLAGSLGIYDGDGDIAVAIRFLPAAARYARETRWHKSEVFTPQRDGGVILRLRLSSTVEIKSRVLSYGASAVVLEPESLRAEIADELGRMLQAYHAPAPAGGRADVGAASTADGGRTGGLNHDEHGPGRLGDPAGSEGERMPAASRPNMAFRRPSGSS